MSTVPTLPALGSGAWYPWATGVDNAVRALGRSGALIVASNEAPTSLKDTADFVCDGVDDQVEINAALLKASRPGDGFGGEGHIAVQLVGPTFYVGNNGTGAITMYPATTLQGNGRGTMIRPMWPTNVDRGCIELLSNVTDHVRVKDLTIGRPGSTVVFNGHGIKFVQTGTADQFQLKSASDPLIQIDNVWVMFAGRCGIWCTGTTGGAREMIIRDCLLWNAVDECLWVDSSSDAEIIGCRANGGTGGKAAFRLGGGNTMMADCKAYFSESPADGFLIDSSRCMISNCTAQDNGRHGFNFTGADVVAVGLMADSNSRLLGTGAGFNIAANGVYNGLEAFDRGQTPGSPQLTQINITGSPTIMLTGRTSLGANGTVHVAGAAGANSYARVVRQGTTLFSVG